MLHFRAIVHRHGAAWVAAPDLHHNSATANELYWPATPQAAAHLFRDGSGKSIPRGTGEVATAVQTATMSIRIMTGRSPINDKTLFLSPQAEKKPTRRQR